MSIINSRHHQHYRRRHRQQPCRQQPNNSALVTDTINHFRLFRLLSRRVPPTGPPLTTITLNCRESAPVDSSNRRPTTISKTAIHDETQPTSRRRQPPSSSVSDFISFPCFLLLSSLCSVFPSLIFGRRQHLTTTTTPASHHVSVSLPVSASPATTPPETCHLVSRFLYCFC